MHGASELRARIVPDRTTLPTSLYDYISRMQAPLTHQTDRIRAMSADEKVRISQALWMEAREVTAAGVRARHPEWSAEAVASQVRELMGGARP